LITVLIVALAAAGCKAKDPNAQYKKYIEDGMTQVTAEKYQDALGTFEKAYKIFPAHPQVHLGKGLAMAGLGNDGGAIIEFDKAINLCQSYPEAHIRKGDSLFNLGLYSDALNEYETGIKQGPTIAGGYLGKAKALEKLGRAKEAAEASDKAKSLEPK